MELLIWNRDKTQQELQEIGGFPFTKGDVLFANPLGFAWSPLYLNDLTWVLLKTDSIFPSTLEALTTPAVYNPTRPREYHINLDALDVSQIISEDTLLANIIQK